MALRRQRLTGAQIARDLAVSPATVSHVLRRYGLSHIRDLEPPEPVRRYEHAGPGELIHIDMKKLGRFDRVGHRVTGDRTGQSSGRGIGWEYLHLSVGDQSRLAYSEIHPDETRGSCLAFLFNALRFFRRHGIRVERVMTDNGAASRSRRYAKAPLRTSRRPAPRPHHPRMRAHLPSSGKAVLSLALSRRTRDRPLSELSMWPSGAAASVTTAAPAVSHKSARCKFEVKRIHD